MSSIVRYDLPKPAWRALHSAFIDVVGSAPLEVGQAFVARVGGSLSFARFMLAINEGRLLNVATIITDENAVEISVAVPVSNGDDWRLFTLHESDHGVTADWLIAAGNFRIDEQLFALLDGEL
jgi:hypothetical protein